MEMVLIDIIADVIDSLEESNFEVYTYNNQKFHIIDKNNNIDFQAKLGYQNYYFKDNISGISVIKTKKYIDDKTQIQQLLVEENNEKCYYSYLEKDGLTKLVNVVRIDGKESLVCSNMNVLNKSMDEIKEYADEVFDVYDKFVKLNDEELDEHEYIDQDEEDEAIKELYEINEDQYDEDRAQYDEDKYDKNKKEYDDEYNEDNDEYEEADDEYDNEFDDEYDDGYDDEYDDAEGEKYSENKNKYNFEFKQIEENQRYGLSALFENNSIKSYKRYVEIKENDDNDEYEISQEDIEFVKEIYKNYELYLDQNEVDGEAKYRIIGDCEAAVDIKSFDTILLDDAALRLKAVVEALQKCEEDEKNEDLEK